MWLPMTEKGNPVVGCVRFGRVGMSRSFPPSGVTWRVRCCVSADCAGGSGFGGLEESASRFVEGDVWCGWGALSGGSGSVDGQGPPVVGLVQCCPISLPPRGHVSRTLAAALRVDVS